MGAGDTAGGVQWVVRCRGYSRWAEESSVVQGCSG